MTRIEFKSEVNKALAHTSRFLVRSGLPVMVIQGAVLIGLFYVVYHDPQHIGLAFLVALPVDTVVMAAWITRIGKEFSRHAPSCPNCRRHLGLLERRRVVAQGVCPQCSGALYES